MAVLRHSALLLVAIMSASVFVSHAAAQKRVVGWVEKVVVRPGELTLDGKFDTGAGNTSLDARIVGETIRNGRKVLTFVVNDRNGGNVTIEREQVGIELVTSNGRADEERPLVLLEICLGNECRETLVNLTGRGHLNYPLLLGRSFMLDFIVVDPDNRYQIRAQQKDARDR